MTTPRIPPVPKGKESAWVRCKKCSWVGYYDYIPYSISNPVITMGCSHGPFKEVREFIDADTAIHELTNKEQP